MGLSLSWRPASAGPNACPPKGGHYVRIALATIALLTATASMVEAQVPKRPTISIVAFDTERTGWMPPPGFGDTVADLLADRLVTHGGFRVMDREWLAGASQPGQRAPMEAIRDAAQQAGIEFLVVGAVTRFSHEESKSRGGLLAIPLAIGGVGKNKKESTIDLTIRVIDVRTGEIVATATASASAARQKTSGGGGALIHGIPVIAGVSRTATGIKDALVNEALLEAVTDAGNAIAKSADRLAIP
jgi:curli biogenesis system outer membrane secretion channel CsgG